MNSNLKMRRLAGIQTPSFYEYVKGNDVKVASQQTINESYWEAINAEDKGVYNGEKAVLIVEMGMLKIAPVQVLNMMAISDFKSKEKAKTDGAPQKTELKNLGTDLSTKDGKIADTEAKKSTDVKAPTTMTNMKSGEKSKTDGAPKSTEMKHLSDTPSTADGKIADTEAKDPKTLTPETKMTNMKSAEKSKTDGAPVKTELKSPDGTSSDGGDTVKTAETMIKDVRAGNRKTDTKGVVKEDLEDLEDDEEGEEDPDEVSCDECGGTFAGKKMKTVATCDQHKGMSKVGGDEDEAEEEEEEEAMQESKVMETAEEMAKRLIKAVRAEERITDTSEVNIESNGSGDKYKSKLADYMPKEGKVADSEAKKPVDVKAPTKLSNMKSGEKSKTDGAPKPTKLKSDTPAQVESVDSKKKSEIVEEIIADHEKRYVKHGDKELGYVHSDKYGADKDKRWHAWSSTGARQGYLDGIHGSAKDAANALMVHHGVTEAWDTDYETPKSKRGMFDGKSKEELESELAKLKKSGPHEKGSAEFTKEKELNFALRAKNDFGKVDESIKHTKHHTIHDDEHEWRAHNDMSAADHESKDPEYSDEEDDGHKVTHAHIKHKGKKLLVGTWDHNMKKGITFHQSEKVKEATAFDAAKRIIAQVMAHNPPHEAPAIDDAKQTKNNGFDYNKLIDGETQVDATRKDAKAEYDAIEDKSGKTQLKDEKVATPKKVIDQINQRIKELEASKEEFGDYAATDGKANALEFLNKVKEALGVGNAVSFQEAQVAWTRLASQIRDFIPSALVNFLATGRNTMKAVGSKPEEV